MTKIEQIEKLIHQGHYFEARSVITIALTESDDLRLKQLHALAMSKSGGPGNARDYLEPIYKLHPEDPETAGILGGVYKELFKNSQDTKFALLSRDTYYQNFTLTGNYYTGINAAAMSIIAGKAVKGKEIANELIKRLSETSSDFWELATLAEAHLLVKDKSKAMALYFQLRQLADSDWGKINSVFNQLWLLNHYLLVPSEILKTFSPPTVVTFVGHMLDRPGRPSPRFPKSIEQSVKSNIKSAIKSLNAKIGYCSLACGGDILFAEAMAEANADVTICLPFNREDFIKTSVEFAGEQWIKRFDELISRYPVKVMTERFEGNPDLFAYHGRVMLGTALLKSKMLHAEAGLITVLSQRNQDTLIGGTRDMVKKWPFPNRTININPDELHSLGSIESKEDSVNESTDNGLNPVRFLLHAAIKEMTHDEIEYLTKRIVKSDPPIFEVPLVVKVDENNILTVCESARSALNFAQLIFKNGKPENIRLSLHAGPVSVDQSGSAPSVNGAAIAEINTITKNALSGLIYCSDQVAATLVLDRQDLLFHQVGIIEVDEKRKSLEVFTIELLP